jgi:hypothetical protein
MHEGFESMRMGLRGMPAAAEEVMVYREIALAKLTESRVHILHVSTAASVGPCPVLTTSTGSLYYSNFLLLASVKRRL